MLRQQLILFPIFYFRNNHSFSLWIHSINRSLKSVGKSRAPISRSVSNSEKSIGTNYADAFFYSRKSFSRLLLDG